jgi:hypothetical protein
MIRSIAVIPSSSFCRQAPVVGSAFRTDQPDAMRYSLGLGISPLCADAYVLLADEATVNDANASRRFA